ncbi:MAG TPA: polysaccharide deacetylase family protein [Oscillospiraceae bacterium]|nr:polysaccharide deacetylase family protein [Oscillospiraceae bacterium]HPK35604.1 polysaccharide deacetylase family protein [Oscillospiraceae bacterium]HPR74668.1 polysaccharide deacetylase family protein [Oscillospiraceae bacterium]
MAAIKRTVRRNPRRSKAKKAQISNVMLAIFALVLVVAAGGTLWYVLDNRQTLDGAFTNQASCTVGDVSAIKTVEKQRYYTIETQEPEEAEQAISEVYDTNIREFQTRLQNLLNTKTLNRDDPAKLTIGFSFETFEQYTTYTIHTEEYISAGNPENKTADYRIIFDGDTRLSAADLFKSGVDYTAKLSDLVGESLSDLDGKLALTDEGLEVCSENTAVIDYTALYHLMAITLPEKYKPVEPTPIDPKVEKVVALTFDDGPYSAVTDKLLDLLDQYNAKATFFVVGYNVDYYPDTVRDIVNRGHCIGVHSTEHKTLTKMTDEEIKKDIFGMQDKIEKICGVRPNLLRPVGGHITQHIADMLNMPVILWDCDPCDWKYRDADKVAEEVMEHIKSGDIILSHDIYESTYEAYEKIIPILAEQGYRFVTVEELIGYTDGAYAGKIIRYRDLCREMRRDGVFEQRCQDKNF